MCPSLLSLNHPFCRKWVWLHVQQLDRQRRENTYAMIPSAQLRTWLEVCSTSGRVIWCMGKNSRSVFCTTCSTTCSTRKFHYHAKFHLWQIECLVSSSQCPCFPRKVTQRQNNGPAWGVRGLFCAWSFVIMCTCMLLS